MGAPDTRSMFKPPDHPPLSTQERLRRAQGPAPALRRRLLALVYEGVALFGVVTVAALVFGIAMGQRHGLSHRVGLQAVLFVVLALYFVWFWTHGGQTLAMRSWTLQLVRTDGAALRPVQALLRYVASWLWFWPALLLAYLAQWHDTRHILGLMAVWIGVYALLSRLLPQRQYLHDLLCRTRLIDTRP